MEKLGLIDMHLTTTILQMVDQSITVPKGILENVPIRVENWEYPMDF